MPLKTIPAGSMAVNAYLWWQEERDDCLLIDAGDDADALIRAVQESGRTLGAIVLTHGHFDHILGARILREKTGAKIYIHEADASFLQDVRLNLSGAAPAKHPFVPFSADEVFSGEEEEKELCGISLRIFHTPGHTPGGICLMDSAEKRLFTGDTLFYGGYGRYDFPGGNLKALKESLGRLSELDLHLTIYPGHGQSGPLCEALGGLV